MSQVRVYIRDQFDLLIPLIHTALPPLHYEYRVLCGTLRTMRWSLRNQFINGGWVCYSSPETGKENEPSDVFLTFPIVVWRTFKTKSCCSVHSGWISLSTVMLNWDFAVFLHEDGIFFLFTYRKPQWERGWCDCGRHINQADSWIFVFFSFFPPWL